MTIRDSYLKLILGDNDDDVSCDAVCEVILNDNKGWLPEAYPG